MWISAEDIAEIVRMLSPEAKDIIHKIRGDLNKLILVIEVLNASVSRKAETAKAAAVIPGIDQELTSLEKVLGSHQN